MNRNNPEKCLVEKRLIELRTISQSIALLAPSPLRNP